MPFQKKKKIKIQKHKKNIFKQKKIQKILNSKNLKFFKFKILKFEFSNFEILKFLDFDNFKIVPSSLYSKSSSSNFRIIFKYQF